MLKRREFINMLNEHPELQGDLFIRGFLISSRDLTSEMDAFPFFGHWRHKAASGYHFYCHELTGFHLYTDENGQAYFLCGHAYDPFVMESDEDEILKGIAETEESEKIEKVNDLTGIFVIGSIREGIVRFLTDPSGMQSACCGLAEGDFYLSSHPQLIADICHLKIDPFVKELVAYKWYPRVMGPYLPVDLTPFRELKRVVPDFIYQFCSADSQITHKRFYPTKEVVPAVTDEAYQEVIEAAADILKKNMELVVQKWQNPWISLTGGIDSNTTFAAANGVYDKVETFSYISAEKEIQDAAAAKVISEHFQVPHHEYQIPSSSDELENYDEIYELLSHNNSYIALMKGNEIRKRIYLRRHAKCDVEVKSWVSETIRAYWYKHYGRSEMPELSAKLYRNLYKIFILNRPLAHKIDRLYEQYIDEFEYRSVPEGYPTADMHYNEQTWGSWGGLNISEMKYCYDITMIYNNRRFLDLLFRVPLEKRISDQHHLDIKRNLNPELADMGIRIVNLHETDFRAKALNVIFTANMALPF